MSLLSLTVVYRFILAFVVSDRVFLFHQKCEWKWKTSGTKYLVSIKKPLGVAGTSMSQFEAGNRKLRLLLLRDDQNDWFVCLTFRESEYLYLKSMLLEIQISVLGEVL